MHFLRQLSTDEKVIELGPYTVVTVTEGYAGVSENLGKVELLEGGKPHILTHAMWRFDYQLSVQVQTSE